MVKVILDNWRENFEKVSLTKLQMDMLSKGLKESKSNVDNLLDGKEVIIIVDSLYLAKRFLNEANKIGVDGRILKKEIDI